MAHIVTLYRELDDRHPGLFTPELAQALATLCGAADAACCLGWGTGQRNGGHGPLYQPA